MTLILSFPHLQFIVMASDSKKTVEGTRYYSLETAINQENGESFTDYPSANKVFRIPKVGCITFWGDITRAEISFPSYLNKNANAVQTVDDLRELVDSYLREELCPIEGTDGDIGFHVGGFMPNRTPRLFHIHWVSFTPNAPHEFGCSDHSNPDECLAVYNRRSDLAHPIMTLLKHLQFQVGVSILDNDPVRRIIFADFLTRYISQLTPDVGHQINTVLISPNNSMLFVRNPDHVILPYDELANYVIQIHDHV
jgi:hypothetical protein